MAACSCHADDAGGQLFQANSAPCSPCPERRRPDIQRTGGCPMAHALRSTPTCTSRRPMGHGDDDGRACQPHSGPGPRPREQSPPGSGSRSDRSTRRSPHKAADMHVRGGTASGAGLLRTRGAEIVRGRSAPAAGRPRWRKRPAGEWSVAGVPPVWQLFAGAMGFTFDNYLQFALKRAKAGKLMLGETRRAPGEGYPRVPVQSHLFIQTSRHSGGVRLFLDEATCTYLLRPRRWNGPKSGVRTCRIGPPYGKTSPAFSTTAGCCPLNRRIRGWPHGQVLQQYVTCKAVQNSRIYHSFNPQGVNIIAASLFRSSGDDQKQSAGPCPYLGRAEITASLGMS